MNGSSELVWPANRKSTRPCAAQREQFERQVGIAAQAVRPRRVLGAMRHQLPDDIDAAVEHVAQRVGVIRAKYNAAARKASRSHCPASKKNSSIWILGGTVAGVDRRRIVERRIAGEYPLRDRIEETVLQFALGARRLQRQRGEDGQSDRAVGGRLGVKRIGDVIGFAETERQRQHDGLADLLDDRIGEPRRIVETLPGPHRMDHCRVSQPGSGWKRGPYFSASRLSVSRISAAPRVLA